MTSWRWGVEDWDDLPSSVTLLKSSPRALPGPRVARYHFSTADYPAAERHATFTRFFAAHFESEPLMDAFEATMTVYHLGPGLAHLSLGRTGPERARRTADQCRADGLDLIAINLQREGGWSGRLARREVHVQPGDVFVTDLAQPLEVTHEGVQDRAALALPRDVVLEMIAEPARLHGQVFKTAEGEFLANFLRTLVARAPTLPSGSGPAVARAAVELLSVSADAAESERTEVRAGHADLLFETVRADIDAKLADPDLTPARLARDHALSRTALYALFEPLGGVSHYIQRRRLEAVRQGLLDPEETRSIAELSYAWGFVSQAHFSRAFRRNYGRTPGAVREMGRGEGLRSTTGDGATS